MLWLSLLTRDTGIPASQRLNIADEADALSFDLAVSLRLLRFDNEKDAANKKFWGRLVSGSEAFGDEDNSILDSDLINGDKYANAATEIW